MTKRHPTQLNYTQWHQMVRLCAGVYTKDVFNFDFVEFAWDKHFESRETLCESITALVQAAVKQGSQFKDFKCE